MPGSSNFLPWGGNTGPASDIQSDATYSSDPTRSAGLVLDQTMLSALGNKLFLQVTMMVAALGGMMATKGYAVSDANLANLEAALANLVTMADVPSLAVPPIFSKSLTFIAPSATTTQIAIWRAQFPCTLTLLRGVQQSGGSPGTDNALLDVFKNGVSLTSGGGLNLSLAYQLWEATAPLNVSLAAGDSIGIGIIGIAGAPAYVTAQVEFTRP